MNKQYLISVNELLKKEYDFDNQKLYQQKYIEIEPMGKRNKFWFKYKNQKFMYKKATTSIYEAYGEILAKKISEVVGIECADYHLAKFDYEDETSSDFKDSVGIITKNFLNEGDRLVPIGEIISTVLADYIMPSEEKQKLYNINEIPQYTAVLKLNNIEDIWPILDEYFKNIPNKAQIVKEVMDYLIKLYFFDIVTLQGDRHVWNFGLIVNDNNHTIKPAPLFDNSNIFNLNKPKTINELNQTINSPKNNYSRKKEKMMDVINSLVYNSTMQFCISSDDYIKLPNVFKKKTQIKSFEYFIKYSSEEFLYQCQDTLEKLEEKGIINILEDIELENGIELEEEFKKYITYIMNINIDRIKTVLNNYMMEGGRRIAK